MAHLRTAPDGIAAAHHRHTAPQRPLRVVGKDATLADLRGAAGIQVTGSHDMVADVDYVAPLARVLEATAADGVPVLGVCFGHQFLGVHFGATLASWDRASVGVADITYQATGPLADETVPVVLTHRDRLTDLGDVLRPCGTGGFGGVQAWRHPDLPMWGVQGHPEADAALTRRMEGDGVAAYTDAELETPGAKGILWRFGALMNQFG